MTRLKNSDIADISSGLSDYDSKLRSITGKSLLGIACHACGINEADCNKQANTFVIDVIPVTAGLGIITHFSQTVAAILRYLGFSARVASQSDTSGLASAYEHGVDGIMMADDYRFVGINLRELKLIDNSEATGRVFAAALDLMACSIAGREVLVMGCGPVGSAAARTLLELGARVVLYDLASEAATSLQERLECRKNNGRIRIEKSLLPAVSEVSYILEATTSENSIPDALISNKLLVAAPGVPLGLSAKGSSMLGNRIIHDTLQLGVAAMAVGLLHNNN